jgi:hypothetical protein
MAPSFGLKRKLPLGSKQIYQQLLIQALRLGLNALRLRSATTTPTKTANAHPVVIPAWIVSLNSFSAINGVIFWCFINYN